MHSRSTKQRRAALRRREGCRALALAGERGFLTMLQVYEARLDVPLLYRLGWAKALNCDAIMAPRLAAGYRTRWDGAVRCEVPGWSARLSLGAA